MGRTAHTPGPWLAQHDPRAGYTDIMQDGLPGPLIASVPDEGEPVQEANARLIAAAPELLEALERIRSAVGSTGDWPDADQLGELLARIGDVADKALARARRENR